MEEGFIRFPRKITKYKFFSQPEKLALYVKLMYMVRFRQGILEGVELQPNQIICTKSQLAEDLSTDERRIRTILDGFEKMGGIKTENVRNRFTLITLLPPFLYDDQNNAPITRSVKETKPFEAKNGKMIAENGGGCENSNKNNGVISDKKVNEDAKTLNVKTESGERENSGGSVKVAKNGSEVQEGSKVQDSSEVQEGSASDSEKKTVKTQEGSASEGEKKTVDTQERAAEKKCYGYFKNVMLTENEFEEFKSLSADHMFYVNKFSAYLASHPEKEYKNHYAQLCCHYFDDTKRKSDSMYQGNFSKANGFSGGSKGFAGKFGEDGSAPSYDIKRAEERAKNTVPIVKKRNKNGKRVPISMLNDVIEEEPKTDETRLELTAEAVIKENIKREDIPRYGLTGEKVMPKAAKGDEIPREEVPCGAREQENVTVDDLTGEDIQRTDVTDKELSVTGVTKDDMSVADVTEEDILVADVTGCDLNGDVSVGEKPTYSQATAGIKTTVFADLRRGYG